jgi:thiol-disulfide isomerase/thioredoxin
MKSINYLFSLLTVLTISFTSCDVIEGPFTEDIVVNGCEGKCRKIFLEDYTGHKCGNCPRAAEKAAELKDIYGDQLVVVAVHAGFFAWPSGTHFTTDFTTDAGDEWDTQFGNSTAGNPNGMVNRTGYTEASHILQHSQWAQKIDELLQVEPEVYIELAASYNSSNHSISISSKTEILQSISAPLNINILISESGIIAYQTDYAAEPQEIEDYEHNHVMRKSLTGSWGVDLGQNTYKAGDLIETSYNIDLDENWIAENISIVAFISNTNTYEVIQAEEIHLIE